MSDRTPTTRDEFVAGARSMVPFLLSAFPLGVIGGTLGLAAGLSYLETFGLAMVVNSGTAQFIGFKLISEGAAWPVIVLTTLILSLRMLIYSTLLAPHVRELPQRWRLLLGFGLIDAVFFVAFDRIKGDEPARRKSMFYFGASAVMYVNWAIATVVGMIAGHLLPERLRSGLDFPMTAVFLVVLASALVGWKVWTAAVSAGALALLLLGLPYNLGLIVAAFGGHGRRSNSPPDTPTNAPRVAGTPRPRL
ncbi:branched-chain amino acid ABC transporter permease [Micromonospora sp. AMSO12t]|uniref:AzlC family ABC transporter permease n=1 Tax=Micromonospora sp. AMSO12t TaxID=2650410 RepID=UPI00124B6E2B|nr:AzlC family ABC transporter permease [Micromonospora sp. AMSO12t]KAB1132490.1 branched-chain amino acid ABC transporter permease [Micromonospora sp. AMSO12t]